MNFKDLPKDILTVQNYVFRLENDLEAIETYANSLLEHNKKYFLNPIDDAKESIITINDIIKKYAG